MPSDKPPSDEAPTSVVPDPDPNLALPSPSPSPKFRRLGRGQLIGRYLVVERIGEGGMGVVYSAYDPELDRRIAIKLVRIQDKGSAEAQARLLQEAKTMARLAHPNVVAVFDAGTLDSSVFLAMELVPDAVTATEWIRTPRPWRVVLEAFVAAGRGIAAAHRAGIIHRDIKPANILIDRNGRVRVTDFGIARDADSPTDPSVEAGVVHGTPAFMAPECIHGKPADERSDQFSFCVALFKALYGETPWETSALELEAGKPLRDPPRGSRVPSRVRRILKRGLALDPAVRYLSMEALLEDLARDPSLVWRRTAGVAGAAGLVVLAGMGWRHQRLAVCDATAEDFEGVWDQATQQKIETAFEATGDDGERAWNITQGCLEEAVDSWSAARKDACSATRIRRQQPEAVMLLRMACLERQRDDLKALTDLLQHPDAEIVEHAPAAVAARPRPEECSNVRELTLAAKLPDSEEGRDGIELLHVKLAEAVALGHAGKSADAVAALKLIAPRALATGYRPLEASALFALGTAEEDAPGLEAASTLTDAALAAEAAGDDRIAARAAAKLALDYGVHQGRPDLELEWIRRAEASLERMGGDNLVAADLAYTHAHYLQNAERFAEALPEAQRSFDLRKKLFGPEDPDTFQAEALVADCQEHLLLFDEAVVSYQETVDGFERALGPHAQELVEPLAALGSLLVRRGRYQDAAAALNRAEEIAQATHLTGNEVSASIYTARTSLLLAQGRLKEALQSAAKAVDHANAASAQGHGSVVDAEAIAVYAGVLDVSGDHADAIREIDHSTAILEAARGHDTVAVARNLELRGEALLALGQGGVALRALEDALVIEARHPSDPELVARTHFAAAKATMLTHGDRDRARSLAMQARNAVLPLDWHSAELKQIDEWMASPANAAVPLRPAGK